MNTYYSAEEETTLFNEINQMFYEKENPLIKKGITLNAFREQYPEDLPQRFHNESAMTIPTDFLQMAEIRMHARKNNWTLDDAIKLEHYYLFTEPTVNSLQLKNIEEVNQIANIQKILDNDKAKSHNRLQLANNIPTIVDRFIPLYHCKREDQEAYISLHAKSVTRPSRNYVVSTEEVILDRGHRVHLELSPLLFYMPELDIDIIQHDKLQKFWR